MIFPWVLRLKSGPHAWRASTLPTEPSPLPEHCPIWEVLTKPKCFRLLLCFSAFHRQKPHSNVPAGFISSCMCHGHISICRAELMSKPSKPRTLEYYWNQLYFPLLLLFSFSNCLVFVCLFLSRDKGKVQKLETDLLNYCIFDIHIHKA